MADPTSSPISVKSESSFTSLNDDFGVKSNSEIANDMAADFCKFLNFSVVKEEMKFNDSVELMLTKLDEFFSLVDMIRSDSSLCLLTTLPEIQAKCGQMEAIFDKIDKLEAFVNLVKECVAATEEKVVRAESDFGAMGGLVKKITSFVSKKKTQTPSGSRGKRTEFVPAKIFSTQEYFNHSNDTELSAAAVGPSLSSRQDVDGDLSSNS